MTNLSATRFHIIKWYNWCWNPNISRSSTVQLQTRGCLLWAMCYQNLTVKCTTIKTLFISIICVFIVCYFSHGLINLFCVVFCRSLFVHCVLFFDLQFLIIHYLIIKTCFIHCWRPYCDWNVKPQSFSLNLCHCVILDCLVCGRDRKVIGFI